jgi:branched-chain amino acid transport system permease protein
LQGFMPPDAFMFDTSGQLVMQTAIGGAGTLFGPLVGAAIWLYLSDFFQTTLHLGASWKLVLGIIFVLLVVFLRHGIVGGLVALWRLMIGDGKHSEPAESDPHVVAANAAGGGANQAAPVAAFVPPSPGRPRPVNSGEVVLEVRGLTKRYGGILANDSIDFSVRRGELRGVIGPNGAGKSTFFKMLTCEIHPSEGRILFEGRDITGFGVTEVCQLGLTKSYQVNQLFTRLTVRENITIAALAERRGPFRLDLLRNMGSVTGLAQRVEDTLALVRLTERADLPVSELAYGEKRRLEIGLALATAPSLLLLDEPLAGMSPRERLETLELLKSIAPGRTMIVIDHDMDAIFELAERITVLREGSVLVEGTPDEIRANAEVQEAYLGGVHAP